MFLAPFWCTSGKDINCRKVKEAEYTGKALKLKSSSVAQSCLTHYDLTDCSMPGFPVHQQLPELAQTHVHQGSDVIQPSHPLSSHSPTALNHFKNQGLFQGVNYSHHVAKVLEFQLQYQSWWCWGLISFRIDWLDLLAVQGLSRVFSNNTVQKHQFFGTQLSLYL